MREGARARRMLLVDKHRVNRITEEEKRLGSLQDRENISSHDLCSITPAERCGNGGAAIIPSSQRAHDGEAGVFPQGHSAHADAANSQDAEEERAPKREGKTSKEEKKISVWEKFLEEREEKASEANPTATR